MSNAVAIQKTGIMSAMAAKYDVPEATMLQTLKATAFRLESGQVTDEQMTALLIVANQYGLNPFTKEIYAFPHKGSIVPIVGVDGWARIINEHPQFDGLDFEQDDASCTCIIHRKDRAHPIKVTEYLSECKRDSAPPWKSHPKRMLRHKALIQCARLAMGYVGIYDEDEAERIIEKDITPPRGQQDPVFYSDEDFDKNFPAWKEKIEAGSNTAERIIAMVSAKAPLTEAQKTKLNQVTRVIEGELQ